MDNSIFGKTMGNLRKRISVKLVNNAKDYGKHIIKPSTSGSVSEGVSTMFGIGKKSIGHLDFSRSPGLSTHFLVK